MTKKNKLSDKKPQLAVRGYLVHLTHYDPKWVQTKKTEQPFDLDVAMAIADALAEAGFNAMLVGVSDGVRYKSHPEFRRRYSVPIKRLETLCRHARSLGLEIIPKLNFSRSAINCHNDWMRAPGEAWHVHFDDEYYWKTAFEVIDEVIAACRPKRFFHVGMDEDHDRSYAQYVEAILRLRAGLKKRSLRTVCWSDSALDYPSGQIYREKTELAERKLPRDCVRLLWNYWAVPKKEMKQIAGRGYELWGAPGKDPKQLLPFRDALLAAGGTGLVMTRWIPCRKQNRRELLDMIKTLGTYYRD